MKISVRYQSKSGNTKITYSIVKSLSVQSLSINEDFHDDLDVLFLGGGIYAGKMDKTLRQFLEKLSNVKIIVLFSTAAGKKTFYEETAKILE